MTESSEWLIYRGAGEPHDGIGRLPAPPPWRDFSSRNAAGAGDGSEDRRLGAHRHLAELHRPGPAEHPERGEPERMAGDDRGVVSGRDLDAAAT